MNQKIGKLLAKDLHFNLGSKEKKDAYTKECFAPIQEKSKSGHCH
jgi:hypothetical protein